MIFAKQTKLQHLTLSEVAGLRIKLRCVPQNLRKDLVLLELGSSKSLMQVLIVVNYEVIKSLSLTVVKYRPDFIIKRLHRGLKTFQIRFVRVGVVLVSSS